MNKIIKSISRPECILSYYVPHYPNLLKKWNSVSIDGYIVNKQELVEFTDNGPLFYHYYTKSKEEYYKRINRGSAFSGNRKFEENIKIIDKDNVLDESLKEFIREHKVV